MVAVIQDDDAPVFRQRTRVRDSSARDRSDAEIGPDFDLDALSKDMEPGARVEMAPETTDDAAWNRWLETAFQAAELAGGHGAGLGQ